MYGHVALVKITGAGRTNEAKVSSAAYDVLDPLLTILTYYCSYPLRLTSSGFPQRENRLGGKSFLREFNSHGRGIKTQRSADGWSC